MERRSPFVAVGRHLLMVASYLTSPRAEAYPMEITVEVPEQYLIDSSPAELGRRIKLYAAR